VTAPAGAAHKPAKWVLAHDHGFHAVARAREIWRYRRLIWFFSTQAFQALYKRTQLGWLWVPIRPLAPLALGAVVYSTVIGVPATGVPYFLLLLVGTIAWNCFDGPWMWGSRGLELNRHLVTKLYFPRMILPLSTMSPGLAEPVVLLGVLAVALPYYRVTDGVWYVEGGSRLLAAPAVLAAILLLAFGLSLWTSLWQARARDVRYMIGYALGFWMYLTPVIYPITLVPEEYRWLMWLNPMAPLVEAFKTAMFGGEWPPSWALTLAGAGIVAVFVSGFWYFHGKEAEAADHI
jgi:lipopolysaccharide transport system permease protein